MFGNSRVPILMEHLALNEKTRKLHCGEIEEGPAGIDTCIYLRLPHSYGISAMASTYPVLYALHGLKLVLGFVQEVSTGHSILK